MRMIGSLKQPVQWVRAFLVALLLVLWMPHTANASLVEDVSETGVSDEATASLLSPITNQMVNDFNGFFNTIGNVLTGNMEQHLFPGDDFVCPAPLDILGVLSEQKDYDFDETYIAYQHLWWFKNDGPGIYLSMPGNGNQHYIKLVLGFPLLLTYCVEETFNVGKGRSKDDSEINVCARDNISEDCVLLKMGDCNMLKGQMVCASYFADQICATSSIGGIIPNPTFNDACIAAGKFDNHGAMCLKALNNFIETEKLDNCVCFPDWFPKSCYDGFRNGLAGSKELIRAGVVEDGTLLASYLDRGWQISGPIVECVEETVRHIFKSEATDCTGRPSHSSTLFASFQDQALWQ